MDSRASHLYSLRNTLGTAFIYNPRSTSPSCSDVLETPSTAATDSMTSSPTSSIRYGYSSFRNKRRSISPSTMHSSTSSSPSNRRASRIRSPFFLRRRPSAVDLALEEEQVRAQGDEVERSGLALMEPRPVHVVQAAPCVTSSALMMIGGLDGMMMEEEYTHTQDVFGGMKREREEELLMMGMGSFERPFVMGGIFEVMEGTC